MSVRQWLASPRQVVIVFLAMTVLPAVALGYLTWRLLVQDESVARQRLQERLEQAADRVVSAAQKSLSELERELGSGQAVSQAVLVEVERDQTRVVPRGSLAFYPVLPTRAALSGEELFSEGERLEFQEKDSIRAVAFFRALANSPDPSLRAGALVRLGRNLRKAGQPDAALPVYDELGTLTEVLAGALPASLLALAGRCAVWEETGRLDELKSEATRLRERLHKGTWQLLQAEYQFYLGEALRWSGTPLSEEERLRAAVADAVAQLYGHVHSGEPSPQRQFVTGAGRPLLLTWHGSANTFTALVAGPAYFEPAWEPVARATVVLSDQDGNILLGSAPSAGSFQVVRTPDATGLPWTLRIFSSGPPLEEQQAMVRRGFLLAGFGSLLLFLASGTYFVLRSIGRELAVARLQSEFVSAVSHEFRTPLTAVRQLSEMLLKGRVGSDEARQQCYAMLYREGERLQNLVEDLLDFGRLEAGRYGYRFERQSVTALVGEAVEEFRGRAGVVRVELRAEETSPIEIDPEALRRAILNLLDNAVKYSGESRTVWVELEQTGRTIAIRVRDQGIGIPRGEQQEIFEKFVRGSNSQQKQIRGTGVGLAIVQHIVQAHRGTVRVESEPDKGSTFTVLLPVEAAV